MNVSSFIKSLSRKTKASTKTNHLCQKKNYTMLVLKKSFILSKLYFNVIDVLKNSFLIQLKFFSIPFHKHANYQVLLRFKTTN